MLSQLVVRLAFLHGPGTIVDGCRLATACSGADVAQWQDKSL
jgi:hypothetical protein